MGAISLLLLLVVASAFADDQGPLSSGPTSDEVIEAVESEPSTVQMPLTDPAAAESLPREDLNREEAVELLTGVFEAPLQAPAGIFDELEVEKFLTPNVAVVPAETLPGEEESPEDGAEEGVIANALLLDSSVPLQTETPSGEPEVVDLSLEQTEGSLQAVNPLTEVEIPLQLGNGIELPGSNVTIKVEGAPEDRSPSIVDQSVAFLPNIAEDTDFAVVPTPTGIETFTHLRSADSPSSQTFSLELPSGAGLEATEDGGAAVTRGEETIITVSTPTAIDAAGADVPVTLEVSDDAFTLVVAPDGATQYPVLVDPLIHTYEWANMNSWQSGICNSSFEYTTFNPCNYREEWGYEHIEK